MTFLDSLKACRFALALVVGTSASPALASPADGPPTFSDPIVYIVPMETWTWITLVFTHSKCPAGARIGEIVLTEDSHAQGYLCGNDPKQFSNFSTEENGKRHSYGEQPEYIRKMLMEGSTRFVGTNYDKSGPEKYFLTEPYRPIRVNSVRIVRLASNTEFESIAAKYSAAPVRNAAVGKLGVPETDTVASDLAQSLAQAFARAPRIQIGMNMGMAQLRGNEVIVDIGVQTQEYKFDVRPGARCTPAGAKQRCTYAFMITGGGSFAGGRLPAQNTGWVTRTDVFDKTGRSYRSTAIDQLMLQAATPPEGPVRPDKPIKQAPTIGCDAGIVWLCKY